jgi:hypothetical protein
MSDIYDRPRQCLDCVSRSYPGIWKQVEAFRAQRKEFGNWPSWCFMPTSVVERIVGNGSPLQTIDQHKHITYIAAIAAWRSTQGIYRFDPTTFQALWNTPVTGEIPPDVLYSLPEWCVFIPTPDTTWRGNRLNGFCAHLNDNRVMRRTELRLLLDISIGTSEYQAVAIPILVKKSSVAESLAATLERCDEPGNFLATRLTGQERAIEMKEVPSLVSLVLYLCSENAEIRESGGNRLPAYPKPKKTKTGLHVYPPDRPTHWLVGYRLGTALRNAEADWRSEEPTSTHARPRPHIRRAHWHSYWVGPRNEATARIVVLKWLPPIAVNVQDVDDLTTTVRDVGHAVVTQVTR